MKLARISISTNFQPKKFITMILNIYLRHFEHYNISDSLMLEFRYLLLIDDNSS